MQDEKGTEAIIHMELPTASKRDVVLILLGRRRGSSPRSLWSRCGWWRRRRDIVRRPEWDVILEYGIERVGLRWSSAIDRSRLALDPPLRDQGDIPLD
jgi:hypothetical protein